MRKALFIAGLLLAGLVVYGSTRGSSFLRGPEEEADLPTLLVSKATLTESAVALGTVKAKVGAEVKVGSQLSGVVADLNVNIGDEVRKGDVLATLDSDEWQARVDVLEAELAAAVSEREYAESELARVERLADIIPQIQIDNIRKNVQVRQAEVERARARLAESRILLRDTVIRAPVSGTIASVSTYKGETVAASLASPTFVTIVDLQRLEVQAFVDETDIGKVHVGQHVTFRVDAYPGQELAGVVQAIYPKAQLVNNVVNYIVIVDILDTKGLLIRPEMTAHVNFILEQKENVVSIPRNALLREGGRSFVVVRTGDEWRERVVKTGLQTPQRIEIVSGLTGGETIVADKQAWKKYLETR